MAKLLRERLEATLERLGAVDTGGDLFVRLASAYEEVHRAYHTSTHLLACFRLLDEPGVQALAERPSEVDAALWFHDAVYDTRASDNEERSAVLAETELRRLGVAGDVIGRIAGHVRATKHHEASSPDAALVIDIDLSILGEEETVYARFEDEIRREYAWVDPLVYAAGRAAVLRRFSERERIYATPLLHERFEARARENLEKALARLGSPPAA